MTWVCSPLDHCRYLLTVSSLRTRTGCVVSRQLHFTERTLRSRPVPVLTLLRDVIHTSHSSHSFCQPFDLSSVHPEGGATGM